MPISTDGLLIYLNRLTLPASVPAGTTWQNSAPGATGYNGYFQTGATKSGDDLRLNNTILRVGLPIFEIGGDALSGYYNKVTFEMWVSYDQLQQSTLFTVMSENSSNDLELYAPSSTTRDLRIGMDSRATVSTGTTAMPAASSTNMVHIVLKSSAADSAYRVYVNGVYKFQRGMFLGADAAWGGAQAYFGSRSGTEYWKGKFHVLRVYTRELSDAEISAQYAEGDGLALPVSPPVFRDQSPEFSNVTSRTVDVSIELGPFTGEDSDVYFYYQEDIDAGPTFNWGFEDYAGAYPTGVVTRTITGLTPGANYYIRAYAINSAGETWSYENQFTTPLESIEGYAALDGKGTISAAPTVTPIILGNASLNGKGTIAATGINQVFAQFSKINESWVTANAIVTLFGVSSIAGKGTATINPVVTRPGAANLSGVGTITPAGKIVASGIASLTGRGTLTAYGSTASGNATISAAGTLAATPGLIRGVTGNALNAVGTVNAKGGIILPNTVSLAGKGTVAADATLIMSNAIAAALSGAGTITPNAIVIRSITGSVTLSGAGTFSVSPIFIRGNSGNLSGAGTITVSGNFIRRGQGALAGKASLLIVFDGVIRKVQLNGNLAAVYLEGTIITPAAQPLKGGRTVQAVVLQGTSNTGVTRLQGTLDQPTPLVKLIGS